MTDQTIENIKSQRDRALHEADQERQRAENAEILLHRAVSEIANRNAQGHDLSDIPISQIQRDTHLHELFPYGYDNWKNGNERGQSWNI